MPDTLPEFPVIDGTRWAPPATTSAAELSRISVPLRIFADSDNSGYRDWVMDQPSTDGNVTPRLNNWWENGAPPEHQVVMRRYWRMVPGTFLQLTSGTSISKSWSYEHGVSTTDSNSISAQLGISGEGISASLTASFSHSVTINDQQTTTTTFTIQGPETGTRVWLLWDLTYEFALVHKDTDSLIPTGTYRGDVDFSDDDHYSGAYLHYEWNSKIVSSGILCPQTQVFT